MTERGQLKAAAVANQLRSQGARTIFVSDALRSRQTGEVIARNLGLQLDIVPALTEVSMGSRDRAAAPGKDGLAAEILRSWIVHGDLSVRLMDGESGHQVVQRMTIALNEIAEACQDPPVIVVGHVASLTVGISALCHNGPSLWGQPLPYATPFPLIRRPTGWQVQWPGSAS